MFRKLVVALDSSHESHFILEEALDLATAMNSEVLLLHVLSSEEKGAPDIAYTSSSLDYLYAHTGIISSYRETWRQHSQNCVEQLKQHAAYANSKGVEVEWTQQVGSPGKMICTTARMWQADLIVMGRHGFQGIHEWFMGSVSNYVTHHANCSVIAINLSARETTRPLQAELLPNAVASTSVN